MKILILDQIQPNRFKPLLDNSKKVFKSNNIVRVKNFDDAEVIILIINSRDNFINLKQELRNKIYRTSLPVFIIERLDSSITWFREFDNIKNLKMLIKNRICNPSNINNEFLFYGRHHYQLMLNSYYKEGGKDFNEKDLSNTYFRGKMKLKYIADKNQKKIIQLLWDFQSSPLGEKCKYFREHKPNFKNDRHIDIFCVNHSRDGILGWSRSKAKNIVKNMSKYKSITNKLEEKEYSKTLVKSKVCVACWGWGEWVHMDASAMYSGCILIKPNTHHVLMDPNIYTDEHYVPCKPDFSDLEEVITNVLENYDKYLNMRIKNREFLMSLNPEKCAEKFWKTILSHV